MISFLFSIPKVTISCFQQVFISSEMSLLYKVKCSQEVSRFSIGFFLFVMYLNQRNKVFLQSYAYKKMNQNLVLDFKKPGSNLYISAGRRSSFFSFSFYFILIDMTNTKESDTYFISLSLMSLKNIFVASLNHCRFHFYVLKNEVTGGTLSLSQQISV